ncbi:long-chain fatty acid transport protein [Sphingomonas kyeonggiensis]|uniref:Long-chain fatty acid transport protein n=1 Tax=Sphingomonas kyeonggiensis TaxID=1268553 RepID=A0A7W7K308_9SPHN|nr:porin [Sphingomonas kyeonggiensis]MBB4840127.1 long-chain fatty acid transport protein [Sphingomonas kyeonggiensis]
MSPYKVSLATGGALFALIGFSQAANAQAFYLQEQSARAAGRAFSGEAADTGSASIWWNPASIGGIENGDGTISASVILPRGEVVDSGTLIVRPGQPAAPVGGNGITRNPINNGVLPSGAIAVPLNDRIALGVSITSPYSFTTDYPSDSWARYSADKTKLRTIDIQPSIGVAVTDWLRVGAGLNIEYTDASLSNALPNLAATLPDGRQELKGDGWDFGWTAGVQLHSNRFTLGLSYKSAIEHTLKGDLTVSGLVGPLATSNMALSGIEAKFYTPSQAIAGARFAATDKLTLNAQVIRYGWDKFDAIRLGAPVNAVLPENYRTSWSYAGGVDYAVSPKVTLRAGVQRATTPTQDTERDARVPDSDRWNFGVGGSYAASKKLSLDLAANYVSFADAPIDRVTAAYAGTAAQTPILTDGELRNASAVVLTAGARLKF